MRARSTVEICYRIILLKIITIARPHHPTLAPNLNGALNRDKKKRRKSCRKSFTEQHSRKKKWLLVSNNNVWPNMCREELVVANQLGVGDVFRC